MAVEEARVVGTLALLDIGNHQAALRKMFVHQDFRGKPHRTAQHLLDTLLEWSRTQGIQQVFLGTTAKYLAAHRFYEKNGFEPVEVTDLPAAFPRMQVDTRFYKRHP